MKLFCKILSITAVLGFSFSSLANDKTIQNYVIVPTDKGYVQAKSWFNDRKDGERDICVKDPKKGGICINNNTREVYPSPEPTETSD